jgi:hypothetical protein
MQEALQMGQTSKYSLTTRAILVLQSNSKSSSVTTYSEDGGIQQTKIIDRPAVLSSYYASSNAIDNHNCLRQGHLQLKTLWQSQNPWFQLITTIAFGMTIMDGYVLGSMELMRRIL